MEWPWNFRFQLGWELTYASTLSAGGLVFFSDLSATPFTPESASRRSPWHVCFVELAENQTCTKTLQAAERSMADSTSCTHVAQMAILRKPTIAQGFVPAFPVEQQTVQPLHRYPHIDIFCGLWRDVLLEGPSTTAPASTTARPSNRSDTC